MTVVSVTGGASPTGRHVLTKLMQAGHRVSALDVSRPDVAVPFRALAPDGTLRPGTLRGSDIVVHLLHMHDVGRDPQTAATADVESTRSLLATVEADRVGTVVMVSSATVYGAHEDNTVPLAVDAPMRAGNEFAFAWGKRLAEELLAEWARAHPNVRVVVLRPVTVLGLGHDDFVASFLEAPRLPLVRGHMPPMQVLHPDDLASAIEYAVSRNLEGIYNVAPDGWLTAKEVFHVLGRKPLPLPESVAFELAQRMWTARLASAPAGGLHYLMHPWVVDARRLRDAGWLPRYTNRETLEAFASAHRGHVTLGPLHTSRRTLAAAGLAGAGALVWGVRHVGVTNSRRRASP